MKVIKKQGKLAAFALALGLVAFANPAQSFAQSAQEMIGVAETLKGLANAGYVLAQGLHYSPGGLDIDVGLGTDNLYMRGQNFVDPGQKIPLENAQEQANAAALADYTYDANAASDKNFWATTYYSSFVGNGKDGYENAWMVDISKYRMKRIGVLGGVTKNYTPRTQVGWLVGYSQGNMSQGVPFHNEGDYYSEFFKATIKFTDFQFGGNFKHVFDNEWMFDATFVGGAQNYSWTRYGNYSCDGYEMNGYYKGATSGNTFSANFAFSRKYDMRNNWYITPCVALESAHSWMYCGSEAGAYEGVSLAWQPFKLTEKIQYSRNTARVGTALGYARDNFGFHGKIYYGTQLGGEDGPSVTVAELNAEQGLTVDGSGYGRDSLQLGGGLWMALDETKTTTLGGGYDAMLYDRATSQTVTATLVKRF